MQMRLRKFAVAAVALTALFSATAPASALQAYSFTVNNVDFTCMGNESKTTTTARITNINCNRVRATLRYIDSGGTTRTVNGGWQSYQSTAHAATSMITYRAGQGEWKVGTQSWWSGFKSY